MTATMMRAIESSKRNGKIRKQIEINQNRHRPRKPLQGGNHGWLAAWVIPDARCERASGIPRNLLY